MRQYEIKTSMATNELRRYCASLTCIQASIHILVKEVGDIPDILV